VVRCHVIYVSYMLSLACNSFLQSRWKIKSTAHNRCSSVAPISTPMCSFNSLTMQGLLTYTLAAKCTQENRLTDTTRTPWPGGHQNVKGSVWERGSKTIYWFMCCVLCLPEAKAWLKCHQHPLTSYPVLLHFMLSLQSLYSFFLKDVLSNNYNNWKSTLNGASEVCSSFSNMWHSCLPLQYRQFCLLTQPEDGVCLTTHNQSLKSTSICIQDILELAACNKVFSTSYTKFMRYGMKLHNCKGQRHKISPCHCSKRNKGEFWKLTPSIGASFINPSSIQLHLKLLPNMSLKFFIDIILPATLWPWDRL
jgi:hypothetical protein